MTANGRDARVRVEHHGPISEIVLACPDRRNALNTAAGHALAAAVKELGARARTRVVVVRGEGAGFCAGGDVKDMLSGVRAGRGAPVLREMAGAVHQAVAGIARLPKPVIASIHGQAYGAGFSLALACDLVVASDDATFCQAFVKLAATPDSGSTFFLPRVVGRHVAAELIMLGETVDAAEAHRLGLVNRVVPRQELGEHVRALAERLATGPAGAYARIKRLLALSGGSDLERQLDLEQDALGESAATGDFLEGIEAFTARRPARFGG
ncbi:enoyl-CoA hydratase [Nonomuraea sp. FMUSA5-5]|uniref:Enoyl-CoA hydratase n=1 Tax=Nonomuraea composti TaxID=2720023 RepID=A0ABX1BEF1_9ACTN|nr:enoyl-CoA hydratase-related protein [Nonomuraea sp. FMUSA5-5]NJP94784.1 enoyl-CoA hydratase [Nonomuraea sp. FMUSA5-5]